MRTDGTTFPVLIDSGAVYGPDGEVRYRATYIQDITQDKRAEAERARLAAIVRSTDDAILSTTLDRIVIDWSRMFVRDAGLERVPIVLLSGVPDLRAVAARVGTPYYQAKPFPFAALDEMLGRALSERTPPSPKRTGPS